MEDFLIVKYIKKDETQTYRQTKNSSNCNSKGFKRLTDIVAKLAAQCQQEKWLTIKIRNNKNNCHQTQQKYCSQ